MKPRVRHSGAHSSGVWQIIYIDLLSQIMIFFVILWSVERRQADARTESQQIGLGVGMGTGNRTVRMVNLPGDILFGSGKTDLGAEGQQVFERLFGGEGGAQVLSFDQGGLAQRKLAIHGHTDEVGDKDENFKLGFERAWSVYREIRKYGGELPDHVVICTHADNTPDQVVPPIEGTLTEEQKQAIRAARGRNRRITIEDQIIETRSEE